jgi:hypothetical protein
MAAGPAKDQRKTMPMALQKIIAEWRVETSFKEIPDQMELARHGAHTFWGLLTRAAATLAAHALLRACLPTSSARRSTHITRLSR